MSSRFTHFDLPWISAVGDGTQLMLGRSLALAKDDPRLLPVLQYISDNGLVLVEEEEVSGEEGLYGRVERSRFATPTARNLILMNLGGEHDD
jgi:hypothetical protein